jgi:uncharacterized phiE125 gp8 family phage protein
MQKRVITAVATEPLTPALVKMHRRMDSGTFEGGTVTYPCIAPGSHTIAAAYSLAGSAVNVLGYEAVVNLNAGTCAGTVTAKLQHSDDTLVWEDVLGGAFTAVTSANDNAIQEIAYTGGKAYVRVVATVAGAACDFAADVIVKTGETQEDEFISLLITAAREHCESHTRRALAPQTLEVCLDSWPCGNEIELPDPPLQSITSVKYKDSAGVETTLTANTDYIADTDSNAGRIVLPYGKMWPSATLYTVNPIRIRYVAGYSAGNPIPKTIMLAMLLLVGHWHDNREAVITGSGALLSKKMDLAVDALLLPHRAKWF